MGNIQFLKPSPPQLVLVLFLLFVNSSYAQNVGINTTGLPPDGTSMLDIESTSKGLLIPRMTTLQRNAIGSPGSPATGLLVFDTDLTAFYYYSGAAWVPLLDSNSGWELDGNTGTTAGTDFMGTTDAQDVVFKTTSIERMRLDASNSFLGIGTTDPDAGVDINSTTQRGATLDIKRYSSSPNSGYIDFHKSRGATVGTNTAVQLGDYLMRIRAYGNDGTATWIQGSEIHTRAEAAPSGGELATYFRLRLNDGSSGLATRLDIASDGVFAYNQSPRLTGASYNYTGISTGSCGLNILSFDAGANSGSDLALIFGRGTLAAHTAALSGDRLGRLAFGGYNTATTSIESSYIEAYASENFSGANNGSDLRFYTSANSAGGTFERMRINEDGTVGIGVTATDRLHIDADAAQDALRVQVSGSTKLRVFADGTVAVGTPSDVAYAFFVSTNSAAKPTSSAWTVSSDRRLKTNVEPFEDGLGVVQKINPVWFRYNGKAGMPVDERGVGTIAQELMKIAPYMISPFSAKDEEGNDVTYYGVDYGAMDFVLINSIKDQQKQIENLEEQIGELVNINELLIKILSGKDGHLEKA